MLRKGYQQKMVSFSTFKAPFYNKNRERGQIEATVFPNGQNNKGLKPIINFPGQSEELILMKLPNQFS